MVSTTQSVTAQQLFETPELERFELVRGELVPMSPPGFKHGCIALEIAAALREFVFSRKLGLVAVEAGFWVSHDPDTVRSPDVAFVRTERIPPGGIHAFFEGAPDLAVEVLSPSDRASEVNAKVQDWLASGCQEVWVVDPQTSSVTVYSQRADARILREVDTLVCEELLPGFRLPVAQVFLQQ
jgi:Uma2 family endonuclease